MAAGGVTGGRRLIVFGLVGFPASSGRRAGYDVWQARVNRNWRFYFKIEGDAYYIIDMTPHPKRGEPCYEPTGPGITNQPSRLP